MTILPDSKNSRTYYRHLIFFSSFFMRAECYMWSQLPRAVLVRVFCALARVLEGQDGSPHVHALLACAPVCRAWNGAVGDARIWWPLCQRAYLSAESTLSARERLVPTAKEAKRKNWRTEYLAHISPPAIAIEVVENDRKVVQEAMWAEEDAALSKTEMRAWYKEDRRRVKAKGQWKAKSIGRAMKLEEQNVMDGAF